MTNHYRWATWIFLGILITGVFAMGSLSEVLDNNGDLIYGEAYLHDDSNHTVTISNDGIYYNITGLTVGNSNGVTVDANHMTIQYTGYYKIDYHISFSGGSNQLYEIALFKDTPLVDCEAYRKLGTGGDLGNAGATCIVALGAGDIINLAVEDKTAPSGNNIDIVTLNLNIVLIGVN